MHVLSAILQYVAVNIWSEGGFCQRRSPSSTYFCPVLDLPLGISDLAKTTTRMAAFQVKPFVFEALFESFLPCLGSTLDLIKSLNTCVGLENFIPTKFHKHPSNGSVVKADYVCSRIYTCISAHRPPPPFLHLNKYIKIPLKFFKHIYFLY